MERQISKKTVIGVLEQRILFASNEITSITPSNDVTQQNVENSVYEAQAVQSFEKDRREIAFIDTTVKDYQTLIDGVDEGVEIYLVSSLAEISAVLQTQKDIDAIHILSHGNTGAITVGNDVLNRDTLGHNAPLLEAMKNSLSQDGDILLYACNVASDGNGQAFINEIATITQADIAASDDLTGNSALSGDWELEANMGVIESETLLASQFSHLLVENSTPDVITMGNGHIILEPEAYSSGAKGVFEQSDGKILVVGSSQPDSSTKNIYLQSLNSDGTVDTSFGGGDGVATLSNPTSRNLGIYSVTQQADGKVIVSGVSYDGNYTNVDFALLRFNIDGTLDTTFGTNGYTITDMDSGSDFGTSVVVDSNGNIIVGGQHLVSSGVYDFAVARYTSSGVLDTTFSTDGKAYISAPGATSTNFSSLMLQSDNKIVIAGQAAISGVGQFALARLSTDGSLDTSFDSDGVVTTDIGDGNDQALGVSIGSDGKIVAAGLAYNSNPGGGWDIALAQYTSTGTLDTTFSGDGKLISTIAGIDASRADGVKVLSDGKIVIRGLAEYMNTTYDNDFLVAKYNADGTLDTTFSGDGIATTNFGFFSDVINAMSIQSDGKILVGGLSGSSDSTTTTTAIVRLNTDGSEDSTFGRLIYTFGDAPIVLNAQALDNELSDIPNYTNDIYTGSVLTLSRQGGANSADVFLATGTLSSISASNGNVIVGGTTVGTYTNSAGTLTMTFNGNSTSINVTQVMEQIAYKNEGTLTGISINLLWSFNDGNTGSQGDGGAKTGTAISTVHIDGTAPIVGPTVIAATASYADTTANDTFSNTTSTISATASSGSISGYGINTGTNGSTVIGAVTYDVSKAGTYGTLYVNSTSGAYVYVPTSDSALNATSTTLTETFTLEATDSAGTSGNTLTITINGVNDTPELSAPSSASYTDTSANDTFANTIGTLSASDRDSGTTLSYGISTGTNGSTLIGAVTYTVSKAGTYGTLYVKSSDGSYVYVPNASAINALSSNATDTFTVSTSDGSLSNTQTFTVNITSINDTPTAQDKTITLNEDTPTVLSASDFGFSDVDSGSALSSVKITSLASDGALEYDNGTAWIVVTLNQVITSADIGAGKLRFNPSENENGVSYATFNFTVSDGALESSAKTITYNITAINDAPVVANALINQNANVDSIFSFVIPANTFLDVDGNTLTYTAQLSGGGAVPTWLSFDAGTGTFGGTPASGDVGTVSVEVIATDNGTGTLSVVDTFDIIVNSGPSVSSISREAGTNATTNANTLNFTVVFSEAVTGVDASDFTLATTGTATGTIGSPVSSDGGTTWTVSVASIVGDGALGLNLNSAGTGIQNSSNIAIASGFTGQTYTIDNTAPTLSISALALLSDTGTITNDFITSTASQTISATLGASLNGGEVLYGSLDGGTVWVDITSKVSGTALTWNGVTLPISGTITFKLTDSVGNDSTSAGTQAYQYDANAPTDIASSVTAINTSSATATTTIATLSTTDITPSDSFTYALVSGSGDSDNTKFQINGNQLKVGATALNDGIYSVRVQVTDTAGHSYEKVLSLTASTPTPEPTLPTTTVDGATVQTGTTTETRTTTDTNGNTVTTTVSTEQLVIAPVTENRIEQTGNVTTADIPLFWGESSRTEWATTASLPTGIGLTTSGSRAPTTTATQQSVLADLLYYIDTTTPSTDPGKTELLGGGESFLNALDNIETLVVNKVTLTSATTTASTTPITIIGTANTITTTEGAQAPIEALVIDASALPAGTILNLENVEFAVIVGDGITVRGGDGANIFFAGAGAQNILLGADDDELYAGDGDDTVGSASGDDKIFGESGNDTVFGGEGNDTLHGGSDTDVATYTGNSAEYTITRDEGYTYVALVSNPTEVDTIINTETIQFADTNYTIATTINQAQIATLYTQILDRQAEMGGFQYWAHSGNELGGMVVSFIQSNEYKTTSGTNWDTMSNEQKVAELYAAVLGRVADAEGQAYWLNDIAQGASLLNIAEGFVDSLELSGLYQEKTDWNFTL